MITMNDIILEGHPTLSKRADEVALPFGKADKETLVKMRQFLIDSQDETVSKTYELREGVGLAAPQIDISKRMLAMYTKDETGEHLHDYMMINPKIISHSIMETYMPGGEGCLSVDRKVDGVTRRYRKVTVKTHLYRHDTDTVEARSLVLRGFVAIVFQHELDHLNGILFSEKIEQALPGVEPIVFKMPDGENKEESS